MRNLINQKRLKSKKVINKYDKKSLISVEKQ